MGWDGLGSNGVGLNSMVELAQSTRQPATTFIMQIGWHSFKNRAYLEIPMDDGQRMDPNKSAGNPSHHADRIALSRYSIRAQAVLR